MSGCCRPGNADTRPLLSLSDPHCSVLACLSTSLSHSPHPHGLQVASQLLCTHELIRPHHPACEWQQVREEDYRTAQFPATKERAHRQNTANYSPQFWGIIINATGNLQQAITSLLGKAQ